MKFFGSLLITTSVLINAIITAGYVEVFLGHEPKEIGEFLVQWDMDAQKEPTVPKFYLDDPAHAEYQIRFKDFTRASSYTNSQHVIAEDAKGTWVNLDQFDFKTDSRWHKKYGHTFEVRIEPVISKRSKGASGSKTTGTS